MPVETLGRPVDGVPERVGEPDQLEAVIAVRLEEREAEAVEDPRRRVVRLDPADAPDAVAVLALLDPGVDRRQRFAERDDPLALRGVEHFALRPDRAGGRVRGERLRVAERAFAFRPLELDGAGFVPAGLRR